MASSSETAGWDVVSPIISRLITKAAPHLLLSVVASVKLAQLEEMMRRLEAGMDRLDYVLKPAFFYKRGPDEVIPYVSQLLQWWKTGFHEAESVLDVCVERQMMRESLAHHRRNWVEKMFMSFVLKYSCPAYMSKKQLKKNVERIERTINNVHRTLVLLLPNIETKIRTFCANSRPYPVAEVIGRDADCEKIVAMLRQPDQQHHGRQPTNIQSSCYSVIGIHGIGGSGKTALAQLVYTHERNTMYFDILMWIHLSPDLTVHDTFRVMLESATRKPCPDEFRKPDLVRENLEKELSGKRFLLVLDDISYYNIGDAVRFEELRHILFPLRVGEAGSRILATSRTSDALLALGGVNPRCISIPELDDDAFFQLFMHYALTGSAMDEIDRRNFEMIGADIAKKLRKSPRAAMAEAQRLCVKLDVHFWLRICRMELIWD